MITRLTPIECPIKTYLTLNLRKANALLDGGNGTVLFLRLLRRCVKQDGTVVLDFLNPVEDNVVPEDHMGLHDTKKVLDEFVAAQPLLNVLASYSRDGGIQEWNAAEWAREPEEPAELSPGERLFLQHKAARYPTWQPNNGQPTVSQNFVLALRRDGTYIGPRRAFRYNWSFDDAGLEAGKQIIAWRFADSKCQHHGGDVCPVGPKTWVIVDDTTKAQGIDVDWSQDLTYVITT